MQERPIFYRRHDNNTCDTLDMEIQKRAAAFTIGMLDINGDRLLEPREIGPASVHHFDRNGDARLSESELTRALGLGSAPSQAAKILEQEALHDRAVERGESMEHKVAGAGLGALIGGGLAAMAVLFLGPVGWILAGIGAAAGARQGWELAQESAHRASARRMRPITQGNVQGRWYDYAVAQDPPFLAVPAPPRRPK